MAVIITILLLIVVFCMYMAISTSRARKKKKKELKELKKNGMLTHGVFNHESGLPVAEYALCEVFSYKDRIEFKSGTKEIVLMRNKITDICVKTDVQIQQHVVSNPGGALAGAIMFGAVGAIIGGKSKTKETRNIRSHLIITYTKAENEPSVIVFNASNSKSAHKIVKEFHDFTYPDNRIEL